MNFLCTVQKFQQFKSDEFVFTKKRGNKEIAFHTTIKHLLKLHIINKSTTHCIGKTTSVAYKQATDGLFIGAKSYKYSTIIILHILKCKLNNTTLLLHFKQLKRKLL